MVFPLPYLDVRCSILPFSQLNVCVSEQCIFKAPQVKRSSSSVEFDRHVRTLSTAADTEKVTSFFQDKGVMVLGCGEREGIGGVIVFFGGQIPINIACLH